jgi:hypothetical protein
MKRYPDKVVTYLRDFSSDKWKIEWNEKGNIENVIVIPAIAEYENIKELLFSLSENEKSYLEKTLALFVINNLKSSSQEVKENNSKSLEFLRSIINQEQNPINKEIINSGILLGLIDAASEGNEFDDVIGGVGLARKTGMDLALTAFKYNSPSKKIIISLDADCTVENNYLSVIVNTFNRSDLNIATIEFAHDLEKASKNLKPILHYETFLRYYVLGLQYAHSPFSYHTIGSTIVCDYNSYIKVGGMNKLRAAEDFYFLQKMAKLFNIHKINCTIVKPSSRESWRVPFGTGKSMMKFQSGNENSTLLYNPVIFQILKDWLEIFNSDYALNVDSLLSSAKSIHPELLNFLIAKNFPVIWEKILKNSGSDKQLIYQRKNWFDAFTTLKFIHHLRDTAFPNINLSGAVDKLLSMLNVETDSKVKNKSEDELSLLESYLFKLREVDRSITNNFSPVRQEKQPLKV